MGALCGQVRAGASCFGRSGFVVVVVVVVVVVEVGVVVVVVVVVWVACDRHAASMTNRTTCLITPILAAWQSRRRVKYDLAYNCSANASARPRGPVPEAVSVRPSAECASSIRR